MFPESKSRPCELGVKTIESKTFLKTLENNSLVHVVSVSWCNVNLSQSCIIIILCTHCKDDFTINIPTRLSFSIKLLANFFIFACANGAGIFTHYSTELSRRKAFLETRKCIENRLKSQKANQNQVWPYLWHNMT